MLLLAWIVTALLGVLAVALGRPRKYSQRHPQAGRTYAYVSLALLAAQAFVLMAFNLFGTFSMLATITLWGVWLAALIIVTFFSKKSDGLWAALSTFVFMCGLTLTLVLLGGFTPYGSGAPAPQAITVEKPDGGSTTLPFKGNAPNVASDNPASGADTTNNTDARPSLDDGKGPVHSWSNLVERVNALPEAQKNGYIAGINARSQYLGTWTDVQGYAALEKKTGVDTRVVLIINSTFSDQQARDKIREDVGDATDRLPIVRISGALVNTRGVDAGRIEDFADGGSQIRVILTVPTLGAAGMATANVEAAKKGTGVLTECTNPATGIVRNPHPHPMPKPSGTPSKPPTAPPTTAPPTTRPPTTAPPTTRPPTTPPVTTPPATPTKGPVPYPSGKPSVGTPPGAPETVAPTQAGPARPTTRPGSEVTGVPAPGATQVPRPSIPTLLPTVAPGSASPGTNIPNPDMTTVAETEPSSDGTVLGLIAFMFIVASLLLRRKSRTS